jgi:hypothetical protein
MERLLTVSLLLSLALIAVILYSLRREHIRVEYSVSWLAAAVVVAILSVWHSALVQIGQWIGISYPPAALASITIAGFLVVLYRLSMIVSGLKDNNVALAQKVAALEYHIHKIEEARETAAAGQR